MEKGVFRGPRTEGAWQPMCPEYGKHEGRYLREAGEMGSGQGPVGTGPFRPWPGTGFYSESNRNP